MRDAMRKAIRLQRQAEKARDFALEKCGWCPDPNKRISRRLWHITIDGVHYAFPPDQAFRMAGQRLD